MFAFEVEYLTGRAVATARHAREQAEWPPHPDRLFSALVDAAFQGTSADGVALSADVRAALEWLEELPPPALAVGEAGRRDVLPVFVPVNDAAAADKPGNPPSAGQMADAAAVLPDRRGKQPRYFPTVVPDRPIVHFIWRDAPEVELYQPALEQMAGYMTYLGHSSSLIRVAVTAEPAEASYEPAPDGRHVFRVPGRGRLRDLESHFRRGARPSPGMYAAYRKIGDGKPALPESPGRPDAAFGGVIVCQIDGPYLPLTGAAKLIAAARDALIKLVDADAESALKQAVKSLVSGHAPDGSPSRADHVAYVPLANVGYPYSDGKVMGFGVVLPHSLGRYSAERRAILRAVAGLERVWCGGATWGAGPAGTETADADRTRYSWNVTVPTGDVPKSLQTWAYTNPARAWATVTPVLCDRHPKEKAGERIEDVIATSVERVVGVRPALVEVSPISRHRGVSPSHAFGNRRKAELQPRHRVHVAIEFDRDVRGPIIAGAGRYAGLGLFRLKREGRR